MISAKEYLTSIRFLVSKIEISDLSHSPTDGLRFTRKKVKLNSAAGGFFEGIIHTGIVQLFTNQSGWITIWFSQYNEYLQIHTFEFEHMKSSK
jgi:hypothetical protein